MENKDQKVQLSDMRSVQVSKFKGKLYVNIREYYKDQGGEVKPGKKGISLTVEQWNTLMENAERINDWILNTK